MIKIEVQIPMLIPDIINIIYEYTIVGIMKHFEYIANMGQVEAYLQPEIHPFLVVNFYMQD